MNAQIETISEKINWINTLLDNIFHGMELVEVANPPECSSNKIKTLWRWLDDIKMKIDILSAEIINRL